MEILLSFVLCTVISLVLCVLWERGKTELTEVYIPLENDTAQNVRDSLYSDDLRGAKIIICKTEKDVQRILDSLTEKYGKIYKKE